MKIHSIIRKVSAAAGSALMIGATMGAAATLSDYPGMFTDDGEITAEVVVGSGGSVTDVVSAVNVAASLGQATNELTQQTVETGTSPGWSVQDGATLDSQNEDLHGGDAINTVRQTLTSDDLTSLESSTFSAAGDDITVQHYINIGDQAISFGAPGDTDDDPFPYVENPSSVSSTSHLYELQANLGSGLELDTAGSESDGEPGNQDVLGEEIDLFGATFTIGEDSFSSGNSGQLILHGGQETARVSETGSQMVTIDGTDISLSVDSVTSGPTANVEINGDLENSVQEGDTFNIDGLDEEVRVDTIVYRGDLDYGQRGSVVFSVGSDTLTLEDGEPVQDSSGDDIEGTEVAFSGTGVTSGNVNALDDDSAVDLSSIEIAVGADDDDTAYVRAGETFQDPVFEHIRFSFAGITPDAAEDGPGVSDVSVSPSEDRTASVSFTTEDGESSIEFVHRPQSGSIGLADSDGDSIIVTEGDDVMDDEYVVMDAGGFDHLFEVTDIDVDAAPSGSGDEATIDLEDQVSTTEVTIDLDADEDAGYTGSDDYVGTAIVDGQEYHFSLDTKGTSTTNDDEFEVTWGTDADFGATGSAGSGVTTVFPSIETEGGGLLSFVDPSQDPSSSGTSLVDFQSTEFFVDTNTAETPEGANGFSASDVTLRVINDEGTPATAGDQVRFFGPDAKYYDKDGSGDYNTGDEVYLDDDGDDVFTLQADTLVAGTSTPSAGTDVTTQNGQDADWSIDSIDDSDGGGWDNSTDTLHLDEDQDDQFTNQSDNVLAGNSSMLNAVALATSSLAGWSGDTESGTISVYDDADTDSWDPNNDAIWLEGGSGADDAFYSSNDTLLAGTAPDGTAETGDGGKDADWTSISLFDYSSGDTWDGNNDAIIRDFHGGGTFSAAADTIVRGATPSDGATGAEYTNNGFDADWSLDSIDADDSDGGWSSGEDNIIIDVGDRGTFSASADTLINVGDNTIDVSDGDGGNDLDEEQFYAIDGDGSGSPEGADDIAVRVKGSHADFSDGDTLVDFAFNTRHTGSQPFNDPSGTPEPVVQDADDSGDYTQGDTVLFDPNSALAAGSGTQYHSSQASKVGGLTAGVATLRNNLPLPGVMFIPEEDADGDQEAYATGAVWDSGDSELEVGGEDTPDAVEFSGSRTRVALESDDDVHVSYDGYGIHVTEDTAGTGSVTLSYPDDQSTAGVAFTGADGSLGTTETTTETYTTLAQQPAPVQDIAAVDSEIDDPGSTDLILVGGPAVNTLVQQLADDGVTWDREQWRSDHEGDALLQVVEDAFSEGEHALIIAGFSSSDTSRAAEYIADYGTHQDALSGADDDGRRLIVPE